MGALNSLPLCSRGREEEATGGGLADRNNNLPERGDQNLAIVTTQPGVEVGPEATSTPKVGRGVEHRDLGDSLSDSLESRATVRSAEYSDSGLEQSGDELEASAAGGPEVEVTHGDDSEPEFELDQGIPDMDSEDEEDEEDVEQEIDEAMARSEEKEENETPAEEIDLGVDRSTTFRPLEKDIDIDLLEEEVCEPRSTGADDDETADSEDERRGEDDVLRKPGEGADTASAITDMLNQLTVGGEFDRTLEVSRR